MRSLPHTKHTFAGTALCLTLVLVGCGGDDDPNAPGATSSSASSSSSTSSSSSSSTSSTSSTSGAVMIPCEDCPDLVINEAIASNASFLDEDGDSSDWLEIYNRSNAPVDLNGWTLSDDTEQPDQWTFPNITLAAGDYMVVWASDEDRTDPEAPLHTNFKLSTNGETVALYDSTGRQVHELTIENTLTDISVGLSRASGDLAYYATPTPGAANNTTEYLGVVVSEVVFSHPGGKASPAMVMLSGAAANQQIHYTLDSTIPTESAALYSGAIATGGNAVIRARIYQEGYIPSRTFSRTFLPEAMHELPIITLVTDPLNLFDMDTGIYAYGDNYERSAPHYGANFWEDWERPIQFNFYEPDGTLGVDYDGGVKIFGGWSRAHDQRSLALFARGQYGFKEFDYPFFPAKPYTAFQSVVLRNSGNDWNRTMMRDVVMTSLMDGTGLDTQAHRPVAAYVNGEYWGMYNLREKNNEHMLASKHELKAKDINILERDGAVVEGSDEDYVALLDIIRNANLPEEEKYQAISEKMDIQNFIWYYVAQIYFDNTDWPGNNIKFWNTPGSPWRWILYDTDFGFAGNSSEDHTNNTLAFVLEDNGPSWPNPPWSTELFRTLIEFEPFRIQLINTFADALNSRFLPSYVLSHIDTLGARIATEMPRHRERWVDDTPPRFSFGPIDEPNTWEEDVAVMQSFATYRPEALVNFITDEFDLAGQHTLSLDAGLGSIKVNTLTVTEQWQGNYFEGIPLSLTAIAPTGYEFSRWEGIPASIDATTVILTESLQVKAVFESAP